MGVAYLLIHSLVHPFIHLLVKVSHISCFIDGKIQAGFFLIVQILLVSRRRERLFFIYPRHRYRIIYRLHMRTLGRPLPFPSLPSLPLYLHTVPIYS